MKQLLAGVVILFVVGIASFLYRNTMERPGAVVPRPACTAEARVCPDGTSVGRTGPSCAFAPCPFPNAEFADIGIAFLVPDGYLPGESAYGSDGVRAAFVKPSSGGWPPHTIIVRRYPRGEGETADAVMLAATRFTPSDERAEDFSRFTDVSVGGRTYREVTLERFEGLIHTAYYLVRDADILRFEVVEHDVTDWMTPTPARDFPEHQALHRLLESLETGP